MMRKMILAVTFYCTVFLLQAQSVLPIDVENSQIKWTGTNLLKLGGHHGTVSFKSGELNFMGDTLVGGLFFADMHTISNTDGKFNEILVDHLKEEDFFHVKQFPLAVLEITKVTYHSDTTLAIRADLTIKGITHEVNFESVIPRKESSFDIQSVFLIDRTKWQVRYGSKSFFNDLGDDAISDAVKLEVWIRLDGC